MTLLLTSYFTRDPHPITRKRVDPDDPSRIDRWHAGVLTTGMSAWVFHDQLSDEFVSRYETDRIRFWRVASPAPSWSNNDWRFRVYLDRLLDREPPDEPVLCTDMFDTLVKRDPAQLMLSRPEVRCWTGTDRRTPLIEPGTRDGEWIVSKIGSCYGPEEAEFLHGKPYCTAALLGGSRNDTIDLLGWVVRELSAVLRRRPLVNANMAAVNMAIHRNYGVSQIWRAGAPLHSQPCRHDEDADVCFVHK